MALSLSFDEVRATAQDEPVKLPLVFPPAPGVDRPVDAELSNVQASVCSSVHGGTGRSTPAATSSDRLGRLRNTLQDRAFSEAADNL